MNELSKNQENKLTKIVDVTQSETGMCYMTEKSVQTLVDGGYVECNISMVNPDEPKEVAVRATQRGIDFMQPHEAAVDIAVPDEEHTPTEAPAFVIESGIGIPKTRRSHRVNAIYPFDDLAVGQSFFVPATKDMPQPSKSLASTVSSASKRYATIEGTRPINRTNKDTGKIEQAEVPAYVYQRKFAVRTVEENGVKGARVWRIEVDPEDVA